MDNSTVHFFTVFMAFFAIMNPVANASLFVALTQDSDSTVRRLIALRSVVVAFIIVSAFAIGGREIFSIFGISLPAFRIAGGLMIGAIGYHMLQGEKSTFSTPSDDDSEKSRDVALDMAITPLGIPILAGPGTIATAMNFAAESTFVEIVRVLAAFGLMCVITFIVFVSGQWLAKVLGQNGIKVISRLMGLILAVVGVQMLIEGVRGAVAA
ncbi:MAG TPA: NAAT family transporter [Pseudomonadales bacterium]|jgi:multiple antibiotic resistance protein|nr:NAAT family transporter [Pseudomonadales bacterium]